MLGAAGEDATKAWEDIQHSEEAEEMMQRYLVGYCPEVSPQTSEPFV
jgi:cytochrome b involved in lipid metabolism